MLRPSPISSANALAHQSPYPLGQFSGPSHQDDLMALLTLSHTPIEARLYQAMLSEMASAGQRSAAFSVKRLSTLTGITSSTTVRRALAGLCSKLSIESVERETTGRGERLGAIYQVFRPEEIFERRRRAGLAPYPKELEASRKSPGFNQAVKRLVAYSNLSRREAQVVLACLEGITNAEIGQRLFVSEQTVKFHLRNIFAKFNVKRRAELISRLLLQSDGAAAERNKELKGRPGI
jgi:DNA-binding CsgD family transcriptional regulator